MAGNRKAQIKLGIIEDFSYLKNGMMKLLSRKTNPVLMYMDKEQRAKKSPQGRCNLSDMK